MEHPDPKDERDLIELLEEEEGLTIYEHEDPPEAWLGHHEPDYSLVPDRVIPLDKEKYPDYNDAMLRYAELAKKQRLRLHKHYDTARHWVFEVFYRKDVGDE